MQKILVFMLVMLSGGCGFRHIDAPAPDEHERWYKPGATIYSTQKDLRQCSPQNITSFDNLRRLDECMLGKGYTFIDPVQGRRKCDSPRMIKLPSCQSLSNQ